MECFTATLYILGRSFERSHKDQPVTVSIGKRDLSISGWQEYTHTLQRLQTDQTFAG